MVADTAPPPLHQLIRVRVIVSAPRAVQSGPICLGAHSAAAHAEYMSLVVLVCPQHMPQQLPASLLCT